MPNFISSGYFTEQVIPRELGLAGPVTRLGDQEIVLCDPVGLHPSMTEALLQRAREVVAASPEKIAEPARSACLFICGHGTSFNDNSTKIIHEQAAAIRALGLFADCQAVLMEQSPFVADWRTLTACPDVIVVPFFIADGLHSFEDIPVLLGLTPNIREKSFTNPHREERRRLWYATAIGTEKFIADVILAQVAQAACALPAAGAKNKTASLEIELVQLLKQRSAPWRFGQVLIQPGFELRHIEDAAFDASALRLLESPDDLRELARLDDAGNFRPLRAAPNLRRGWLYRAPECAALRLALDYLYPADLANAVLAAEKRLPVTTWRETAERQTGRFRMVRELDDEALASLIADNCASHCLKRRLWSAGKPAEPATLDDLPLLCPEACNFLVGKAREKLKGVSGEE